MSHYLLTYYENSRNDIFPKEIRGLEDPSSFKEDVEENKSKYSVLTTRFLKGLSDPNYFKDDKKKIIKDDNINDTEYSLFISY